MVLRPLAPLLLVLVPPVLLPLRPVSPPAVLAAPFVLQWVMQSPWLWVPAQLVQVAHSLCLLEPAPLLLEAL